MIDPITPRIDHTVGTDPQSLFEVPFPFFSAADLTVSVGGIVRAQGAGYSVSGLGNPDGGRIRFAVPLSNTLVTIARRMPLERAEPVLADDPALAQTLNGALDRQTALIQQVANDGTRALRQPDAETPQDMTLPAKAVRASAVLGFDAAGSPVALTAVTPAPHAHAVADVTGLQASLDGKAAAVHTHNGADITAGTVAIDRLPVAASGASNTTELVRADDERLSNPRAPLAHAHAVADVTGLQNALDGKAATGHTHNGADITDGTVSIERLPVAASGIVSATALVRADDERLSSARAPLAHTHVIADTAGLQNALDGKAAAVHTHNGADITAGTVAIDRLPVAASGASNTTELVRADDERLSNPRAPLAHAHTVADVTGLQNALDGKAAAVHTHNGADITAGTVNIARLPVAASGTSSATELVRADDVRLSNTRVPAAHTHTVADVTGFAEAVDDRVAGLLTAGANITLAYDDTAGTLTIASTGTGSGSGSSGSSRSFITAGAVTAGRAVTLRSDGAVEAIAPGGLSTGAPTALGGVADGNSVALSSTQFLFVYIDPASNGYAVICTVSGDAVIFGTPAQFASNIGSPAVCYDSVNNKMVIAYVALGSGYAVHAVVTSVSGSTISFGAPVTVFAGDAGYSNIRTVYHAAAGCVVVMYRQKSPDKQKLVAGILSGNNINFGTPIDVSPSDRVFMVYDPDAQRTVVASWNSNGYQGAVAVSASGTTLAAGSEAVYVLGMHWGGHGSGAVYVPSAKSFILVYRYTDQNYGYAVVGKVSGSAITFGTPVQFASNLFSDPAVAYDASTGKVIVFYSDRASRYGILISGTVSGTTVTFEAPVTYRTVPSQPLSLLSLQPGKIINMVLESGTGKAIVVTRAGTLSDWIGIASQSATAGQSVPCVLPGGIAGGLSGLTPGQVYYLGPDGSPAVTGAFRLGRALSSSDLLVG